MKQPGLFARSTLAGIVLVLCGCGTLQNGRGWGQDTTIRPGWDVVRESAVRAARSPRTWAPLAGALLLQVGDWDQDLADWASNNTPVFGSQRSALDASGVLKDVSTAAWLITALATPGGDSSGEWLTAKSRGLAVVVAASLLNGGMNSALSSWTSRTGPDGRDSDSFPSGHSSVSALYTTPSLMAGAICCVQTGESPYFRTPAIVSVCTERPGARRSAAEVRKARI